MNGGRVVLSAVVLTQLVLAHVAAAEEAADAAKTAAVDPTGFWKWDYTFNDNPAEFRLKRQTPRRLCQPIR
jgi:hypothetical protein